MTISIQRDVLHQAIDKLPDSTLIELAKFIEFLQFKALNNEPIGGGVILPENYNIPTGEVLPSRILGLHKGQGWISEDFNEPLPDTFWLGE